MQLLAPRAPIWAPYPVVCAQIVHLLLPQRLPELLADELDDLKSVAQPRLVLGVAALHRSRVAFELALRHDRLVDQLRSTHRSASCRPILRPTASNEAAEGDAPVLGSLKALTASASSSSTHTSAARRLCDWAWGGPANPPAAAITLGRVAWLGHLRGGCCEGLGRVTSERVQTAEAPLLCVAPHAPHAPVRAWSVTDWDPRGGLLFAPLIRAA
jgi:hypothetical protein